MLYACPNVAATHRLVGVESRPADLHARARRGVGHLRARIGDGRAGGRAGAWIRSSSGCATTPRPIRRRASRSPASRCASATAGAEAFGWARPQSASRGSMRDGNVLVGWGMATATYPTQPHAGVGARCALIAGRHALVQCGTQDIGTGTYTVMAQVAADALGLPVERVRVRARRHRLAAGAGLGRLDDRGERRRRRCRRRAQAVRDKLSQLASRTEARAGGLTPATSSCSDGVVARADAAQSSVAECWRSAGATGRGDQRRGRAPRRSTTPCTPSARSSPRCASIPISARSGSAAASARSTAGRILNAKTARSQLIGGIVFGHRHGAAGGDARRPDDRPDRQRQHRRVPACR